MTTQAQVIESILQAPQDRWPHIIAAAKGEGKACPITKRKAADIIGCHPRTLDRYATAGILHVIRISPRKIRFNLHEVERLATEGAEAMRAGM